MIEITVEIVRAGRSTRQVVTVAEGTLVRSVLRAVGQSPEGCAVFIEGVSVPRDRALASPTQLTVVPTFSGG
ncbi:MAG: MoaD/ThiS family protein [Thermoplasmata archaeon]|nr:MoaD/ThiS family protein [Thermoplasmata archaeon]